jgi:threonine dehydrogenase-like Zn-dependent dehydrogenase
MRGALLHGAERVLATDTNAERLRFAEAQGANAIEGDIETSVRDATDGTGVDLVIDAAGFESTWALALRAARAAGRITPVGLGSLSGSLEYISVIAKEVTITGSYAWTDRDFERSLGLLSEGALEPTGWITTVPLEKGQRAFEEAVRGEGPFKVALDTR